MAEITRKRTGELLRKLFEILITAPEGLPARQALDRLADSIQLTDYEAGMYDSGSRRFDKIVRFATVDCVKAGWLLKHKGNWSLTDAGLGAYRELPDPEAFYKEAVRLYRMWKKNQSSAANDTDEFSSDVLDDAVDKSSSITFEQAEEQAWTEIESHVGLMDPYEFQRLVADLLKAMGYYASWIAPPGKDGGLDIVAYPDPLGTRPPRIKVQVKRQQQRINADGVRAFVSLVNEDDAGLFVAVGGFTRDAEDFARMQERRKITLIDLERLVDLWTEFYPKLTDLARERLPLTPIYFLAPNT
ncbi:restriction endonuclease [Hyphomicrobium facile]|uniref:Restriction system protein n=1 Tax=Hyphomicrobium facile TaxID=51670 RepID=A0A1I7N082_9HYPH|nr:restriction endonuclease [Hyphomicrobium facile]SFV28061.1 restriction system protein [Hyphomicrobium facile]